MGFDEPSAGISRRRVLQAAAGVVTTVGMNPFARGSKAPGPTAINPAATTVVAIVGIYQVGPKNTPILIHSLAEFKQKFGMAPPTRMTSRNRARPWPQTLLYAVTQYFQNSAQPCYAVALSDGETKTDLGNRAAKGGIYALEGISGFDILVLPGISETSVLAEAEAYCVERKAFLIADAPKAAATSAQVIAAVTGGALPRSDHAAIYFPWISMADPLNDGKPIMMPPSGAVAGIYASNDTKHGVWKAPAGTALPIAGALALASQVSDAEAASLSAAGVNPLRAFPGAGLVVWGSRTLQPDSSNSDYKYINVRRFQIFVEKSLQQGLSWVVFENNGPALWAKVQQSVSAFLQQLYQQGALQGSKPSQAYFVRCDKTTMTQADIDAGRLIVLVGVAMIRPAEFVVFQIGDWTVKKPGS